MFTLIDALGYRCNRDISQKLRPFQVLVGPNASGKTTFLEIFSFLRDLVQDGPEAAVDNQATNFSDLVWMQNSDHFELAVEAMIPEKYTPKMQRPDEQIIRYEIKIGIAKRSGIGIIEEKLWHKKSNPERPDPPLRLFPRSNTPRATLITKRKAASRHLIVSKVNSGNDNFYSEVYKKAGRGWAPSFRLGPKKSALGNMPDDESQFPATTWFRRLLTDGVESFMLNSRAMRMARPPKKKIGFLADGSNLPWVIRRLRNESVEDYEDWLSHVQTALPDLSDVRTVQRDDDKHMYLKLCYRNGLEVPSWMASDGTLRLLALTLPAYLKDMRGVYLVEEPENGIHPKAVETVYQSLSSTYHAQILVASHSPILLGIVRPEELLCFSKTTEGASDIVLGDHHPALQQWQGDIDLATMFAAGVLG